MIRSMVGVISRTSCTQLFKELNILTLASLYILEVTCLVRKYCQSLEENSKVHNYNTRRKMDMHVKLHNTEVYKKSVINMGTRAFFISLHLFSIPEIHQSGYRTCQYIKTGIVQNES